MKELLGDDLADHYLDRDATDVPDPAVAERRAKLVLDIDPDNVKARFFLLRLNTHHVEKKKRSGDQNLAGLYSDLNAHRRHAEWLEERSRVPGLSRQDEVKSNLASYYNQLGEIKHAEGQKATGEANDAIHRYQRVLGGINPNMLSQYERLQILDNALQALNDEERSLEHTRQCYRESDSDFRKSLQFDPVNPGARQLLEIHEEQYGAMENILRGVQDERRQIRDLQRRLRGY